MTSAPKMSTAALKARLLLPLAVAIMLASSCAADGRKQLSDAVIAANQSSHNAKGPIARLSRELAAWSKAKNISSAARHLRQARSEADAALSAEVSALAKLNEAQSSRLDAYEQSYLAAAQRAYEEHISALTVVRDKLLVMSDIYAVIDGVASAERSLDAAANNAIDDDRSAVRTAKVKLTIAQQALSRSGSSISVNELQRVIELHTRVNRELDAAVTSGSWEQLATIASGSDAQKAGLLSGRATTLSAKRISKLMERLAASKVLFSGSERRFAELNSAHAALRK